MNRWKLTIEYDGTNYAGWQRQGEGIPSVQAEIEQAIFKFCAQDVTLHVAGRTDAGVHARGQVAHVDLADFKNPMEPFEVAKAINAHIKKHRVSVISAEVADNEFHARFHAVNKLYRYRIINRPAPPALEAKLVWHVKRPLNVAAMHEAGQVLLGHHDFTTFRDSQCQAKSPEKTLDRLDIASQEYDGCGGQEIIIETEGRSFLHHQVRNMVGTLALVGEGKWSAADVRAALEARDRTKGGPTAPASGLYLMRVDY
ncbi:MAG: tRNA pseudouridine(38-40) synthase TruA [Alphaproteobacteria bacterium]|nr:tRNA pseudouridine(38-40) synthase TruA [Alphaproteobacteria bacterium]MCD8520365.1 tRNA pseudouridine(38-40) synthase TruA [Alphaproteobacteria bacterium]MCD8526054.1 tRNA pseudouridine(38-40) synthase TruA [Alphaproteobacteria bacterium]MCD8571605.1 tRNA pseudouridine(38-40) synthase TruA [Alphaproteobacteria bacterium]